MKAYAAAAVAVFTAAAVAGYFADPAQRSLLSCGHSNCKRPPLPKQLLLLKPRSPALAAAASPKLCVLPGRQKRL
jgi:hypothetical protein